MENDKSTTPEKKTTLTTPLAFYIKKEGSSEIKVPHKVEFSEETEKWFYIDERDKIKYEYDPLTKAWFPMFDEELINAQQSIYDYKDSEDYKPETREDIIKKKRALKAAEEKKTKTKANTSLYVTGLPFDVTLDELKETFGKFGLLMEDFVTGAPKIKIYQNKDGYCKGDALITYFKEESVELAINLLDDTRFRYNESGLMRVQKAVFPDKETSTEDSSHKRPKLDKKLIHARKEQLEKKLDWVDKNPNKKVDRYNKIVLLKHMFTPAELDKDPALMLELKEDIRSECEKVGEVTNVVLYDKSEEGACTVRFKEELSALACVKLMNGRFFAQQRVEAKIFDGSKYERSQKAKTEDDEKAEAERLENFAKWLESQEDK